jgi:hypothetical protein
MDFEERFNKAVEEAKLEKEEWEALDHSECKFEGEGEEVAIHYCNHPLPLNKIPSRKIGARISQQMIDKLEKLKEITNERFVE